MALILPLAPKHYEQTDQDRVRRLVENALDTLSTFQNPASGGGGGLRVEVGDALVGDPITALDFTTGHFLATETPTGEANISLVTGTVIPNLNADLLDGFDETAFGRLAAARTWSALQTFAGGIQVAPTILFTGTVRAADTLTNPVSVGPQEFTAYLAGGAQASFGMETAQGFVGTRTDHTFHFRQNNLDRGRILSGGSLVWGTDPGGTELVRVGGSGRFSVSVVSPTFSASTLIETTGAGVLRLADPADVGLLSTTHAFQIGASSSVNIAMDGNEIEARNNGAASTLNLNADGGAVHIFALTAGTFIVNADPGSGTVRVTGSARFTGEIRSDNTFLVTRVGGEPSMRFQRDLANNPRWDIGRMNSSSFRWVFADDLTSDFSALELTAGANLIGKDPSSVTRWSIGPSGAATGFELGRTDGTAATAFIDFHSGATAVDYDVRIQSTGGTGVIGGGTFEVVANSGIILNGPLSILGVATITSAKLLIDGTDATFAAGEIGILENATNLILGTRGSMVFDVDNDANGSNVFNWTAHNQATTLMRLTEAQELTSVTNNTGSLGTAGVRWGFAFVRRLRLVESTDAAATSTDHAFQVGLDGGTNIIMDENEIMARNNGVVSGLNLNADGGTVAIHANLTTLSSAALTVGQGNSGGIISVRTLTTRDFLISELVNNTGGGATGPIMRTRRARGTDLGAGRSAVQTNDEIGAWAMQGFGATTYFNGAALVAVAAENWTDTAQGGNLLFQTTQVGTTGIGTRWTIASAGTLTSNTINAEVVITAKRSDAGTVGYELGSANATGGSVYIDVSTTSGVDFHTRIERGVGTNGIWRFRQTGTGGIEFWPDNTASKFKIATALVETVSGTDLKIGDLGTFDSADVPTDLQLLVYHAGATNKWQAESIQFIYNAGDAFVALLADNTSVAALYSDPGAGADSPVGAPPAPVIKVHASHKAATIQVLASADPDVFYHDGPSFPADFRHFLYEYSLDAFATAGIALATASSDKVVHGRLVVGSTYSYRVRAVDRAGNASANSSVVSVVAVANSEVTAFGVLLASEIAVDRLAALSANIGIITAGQMRNAGNTAGINLGGVGGIPSGWINTINFENTSIPTGSKFTIDFFRNTIKIKDEQGSPITRVELGEIDTGTGDWGLLIRGSAGNPTAKLYGADTYLQNDAASPTHGLLVSGSLPGTWTRYVNLTGTGLFLKHDRLEAAFDGSVTMFRGNINQPVFKLNFNDFFLQNDVASPTQGVLIDGTIPGTWTRYLNLNGSGSFLKHERLQVDFDGTVLMYQSAAQPLFKLNSSDFLLQNDAASPTQGILVDGTLPGTWTRYLNLNGSGSMLKHDRLDLKYDGTAEFKGTIDIDVVVTGLEAGTFIFMRDSDVAHGMTSLVPTDVLGALSNNNSLAGGLAISGFVDTDTNAINLQGHGAATPTVAPVAIQAWKKSGTSRAAIAGTERTLEVRAGASVRHVFEGAGALWARNDTPVEIWRLQEGNTPGAPALSFFGDTDTGVYRAAADVLRLSAGGIEQLGVTGSQAEIYSGGGPTNPIVLGGRLNVQSGSAASSGTTETDLMTYTVPANTLNANGKVVRVMASGTLGSGTATKNVRFYFAGSLLFTISTATAGQIHWYLIATIIRTGASLQEVSVFATINSGTDGTVASISNATGGGDTTTGLVLKVTGQTTNAAQPVTQENMVVEYLG